MKLKKRLLSLAMLCVAWVGSAWADTTLLTEANGWQKVTDLSKLTLSDYYFAFVDNDKDPVRIEKALRAALPPAKTSDFCHRLVLTAGIKSNLIYFFLPSSGSIPHFHPGCQGSSRHFHIGKTISLLVPHNFEYPGTKLFPVNGLSHIFFQQIQKSFDAFQF